MFSGTVLGEEQARVVAIEKTFIDLASESLDFDADWGGEAGPDLGAGQSAQPQAQNGPAAGAPGEKDLEAAPVLADAPEIPFAQGGELGVDLHRGAGEPDDPWWIDVRGTGEMLNLRKPDAGCIWALGEREQNGQQIFFLAQYNETSKATFGWVDVADLLELRLHRAISPPGWESCLPQEQRGLMIREVKSGGTAWRSEQLRAKTSRALTHAPVPRLGTPADPPAVHLKFWIYQIERGPNCHIMWELPRIAELAHRGLETIEQHFEWMSNNLRLWPKVLPRLDLGGPHYQRGHHGSDKSTGAQSKTLTGNDYALLVHEPCGTAVGVIVCILLFTAPQNSKEQEKYKTKAPETGAKALI